MVVFLSDVLVHVCEHGRPQGGARVGGRHPLETPPPKKKFHHVTQAFLILFLLMGEPFLICYFFLYVGVFFGPYGGLFWPCPPPPPTPMKISAGVHVCECQVSQLHLIRARLSDRVTPSFIIRTFKHNLTGETEENKRLVNYLYK